MPSRSQLHSIIILKNTKNIFDLTMTWYNIRDRDHYHKENISDELMHF